MEGPISFWGYKEQESDLILPEHDEDDDEVLIINYGIIIKSISTLTYMVWHVDRYTFTFELVIIHWTNEMSFSTHSRILFSSWYFHYEIFIHEKCLEN